MIPLTRTLSGSGSGIKVRVKPHCACEFAVLLFRNTAFAAVASLAHFMTHT